MVFLFVVRFERCESVNAYIHAYHIHTYVVYFMLLLLYVIVFCVEDVYALERASLCTHTYACMCIHTYVVYFMSLLLYVIVACVEDVYALERASLCMHT